MTRLGSPVFYWRTRSATNVQVRNFRTCTVMSEFVAEPAGQHNARLPSHLRPPEATLPNPPSNCSGRNGERFQDGRARGALAVEGEHVPPPPGRKGMLFGEERRPAEPADYACVRISPATVADDRGDCVYTLSVRRYRGIYRAGQTRSPRFATLWVGNHANPPMPAGVGPPTI